MSSLNPAATSSFLHSSVAAKHNLQRDIFALGKKTHTYTFFCLSSNNPPWYGDGDLLIKLTKSLAAFLLTSDACKETSDRNTRASQKMKSCWQEQAGNSEDRRPHDYLCLWSNNFFFVKPWIHSVESALSMCLPWKDSGLQLAMMVQSSPDAWYSPLGAVIRDLNSSTRWTEGRKCALLSPWKESPAPQVRAEEKTHLSSPSFCWSRQCLSTSWQTRIKNALWTFFSKLMSWHSSW